MRRWRRASVFAAFWLVIALTVYIGGYLWVVEPREPSWSVHTGVAPYRKQAFYRHSEDQLGSFFRPAVYVDQALFPRRWQEWFMPEEVIDTEICFRSTNVRMLSDPTIKERFYQLRDELADMQDIYARVVLSKKPGQQTDADRQELATAIQKCFEAEKEFRKAIKEKKPR